MREEVLRLLHEHGEEYLERLTVYAERRLRELVWRGELGGPVPGRPEPADFALGAIADVLEGVRQWAPATCPDFLQYLYGVVRSSISNDCTAAENKSERTIDQLQARAEPDGDDGREVEFPTRDPDDAFLCGFLSEIEGDPDLVRVVELIMDGHEKRAEIATAMGLSPSEITNLQKRLQRRLRDYISALQRV